MTFNTAFNTLSDSLFNSLCNPTTPVFWIVNLVGLVALGALFRWAFPRLLALRGITYVPKTMFGKALIFDSQDADGTPIRLLNVNNAFQSVSYIDKDLRFELACMYHRNFAQIVKKYMRTLFDSSGLARCVVVGGGGYSFPKYLIAHHKNMQVFTIEIDPVITELAKKHFFLDDLIGSYDTKRTGRLQLCCADGWQWLRDFGDNSANEAGGDSIGGSAEKFDLIVNDAFAGKRPLGPLGTLEGAKLIHEHLCEHGLYIANVIAPLEGKQSKHLYETLRTFEQVFAHVYMIAEYPEDPKRHGCNVMVTSDTDLSGEFGIRDLLLTSL